MPVVQLNSWASRISRNLQQRVGRGGWNNASEYQSCSLPLIAIFNTVATNTTSQSPPAWAKGHQSPEGGRGENYTNPPASLPIFSHNERRMPCIIIFERDTDHHDRADNARHFAIEQGNNS